MDDADLLRSANLLVERYGRNALLHSGGCHIQFYERGDHEAVRTWLRIDNAIVDLLYPEYVVRHIDQLTH